MKRILAIVVIAGVGTMAAHAQQNVRYFLSIGGLSNPELTDSPAIVPNLEDPLINPSDTDPNVLTRLYLWADISTSPSPTDLKGFTLQFRATGNVRVTATNIWQNNYSLPGFARWNAAGFPGLETWDTQLATPGTTVAVLEPGITNGAFATFDDQYINGRALVGYVEVRGNLGELHIVNVGSGFLNGSGSTNRVYLGFDDPLGAPAEVIGQPYDDASPEATFIPEPTSLALLGLAAVFGIRRR